MRTYTTFISYITFASSLCGQIVDLDPITIQERHLGPEEDSVSAKQILLHKPLDLAEVLAAELPQANLIRKGGTANDLSLRGLSGDNLNILNDSRKIFGACMNRMDPPSAHSSNEQVERIEVVESIFDITRSGSLGGRINVITRDPDPGFGLKIAVTAGDFSYLSTSAELHGGNEDLQWLGAYSYQESDSYEDGNGNSLLTFPDQTAWPLDDYLEPRSRDQSFKTERAQVKSTIVLSENHQLKLSYSEEHSTDVLYPGLRMDSKRNHTDQYGIRYLDTTSTAIWDEITVDAYTNKVDHLMDDALRKSSRQMASGMQRPTYVLERGYFMETEAFSGVDSIVFDALKELDSLRIDYGLEWLERDWDVNNRLGAGMPNAGPAMEIFNEFVPDATARTLGGYIQFTRPLDNNWTMKGS